MNPLDLPWSSAPPKKEPEIKERKPSFIGIQNEVVRDDASSSAHITVAVRGVSGVPSQEFKVAYVEGQSLGRYLTRLKLKRTATYNAVYDQTNLENGRCRMTYIPQAGANIAIGPPAVGSAYALQRTNHDARRLATNMGGGAKVVERKK
jgi:hypothetical protein